MIWREEEWKLVQSRQNRREWERHVDRWTCEERSQCRWMSLNTWGQSSIQCTRGGEEERAGRAAWVETRIRNESIRGTSQSQRGWGVQRRERTYTGYTQEEKRTTSEDISGCSEGGLEWQRRSIPPNVWRFGGNKHWRVYILLELYSEVVHCASLFVPETCAATSTPPSILQRSACRIYKEWYFKEAAFTCRYS